MGTPVENLTETRTTNSLIEVIITPTRRGIRPGLYIGLFSPNRRLSSRRLGLRTNRSIIRGRAPGSPGAMRRKPGSETLAISKRATVRWWLLSQYVSVQAKSEGSRASRLTASSAAAGCAAIGNCNTVAR